MREAVKTHRLEPAAFVFREVPDDYLVFLGRFTEGKGVLEAIDVARRTGHRLLMAAPSNDYYQEAIAPHVDGTLVQYVGEVRDLDKAALLGGARALLYPVQAGEPFGLVLAEAMACGTPVAALDRGAVHELVDVGVTGCVFPSLDDLIAGLSSVLRLDRRAVYNRALERFSVDRMVDGYLDVYSRLVR